MQFKSSHSTLLFIPVLIFPEFQVEEHMLKKVHFHAVFTVTVSVCSVSCAYTVNVHGFCFVSAWLDVEDDPVIDRVNKRIEDITGLTVDTAELLQVDNITTL